MVTNRRKKVVKYRGHTSHGGGHHKKRRGAGSRGGKGRAGSGKRAGHKRYGIVLGSTGFLPRRFSKEIKAVNLSYFTEEKLQQLLKTGQITQQANTYNIDLKKIGFDKLLSTGNLVGKISFTADYCSQKAMNKVIAAGGQVKIKTSLSKPELSKESEKESSEDNSNQP